MINMTPSTKARQLGCESLAQVIKVSGVAESTLYDWFKHKPKLFEVVCIGVATGRSS